MTDFLDEKRKEIKARLSELKPLVEEYHKCLKTGCRVEARQYRTGERLAPAIGLLSVLAVRLLQLLKNDARG